MRTNQEILDTVSNHLFTQKKKSLSKVRGKYRCKYRGDNGLKCSIGALIPDEHYLPIIEGGSVTENHLKEHPVVVEMLQKSELLPMNFSFKIEEHKKRLKFLQKLQFIHDYLKPNQWKAGLNRMASVYNLKPRQ